MNLESELELQSYLDGELSDRQARNIAERVAGDDQARLLLAELKMTKAALAEGELEIHVPETREFYWSKIQREIERAETAQPAPKTGVLVAWRRILAPLAGVALVTFLTVYTFNVSDESGEPKPHLAVVENLSEHTGALS